MGIDPQYPAASMDSLARHLGEVAPGCSTPSPPSGNAPGGRPTARPAVEADARRVEDFLNARCEERSPDGSPDEALVHCPDVAAECRPRDPAAPAPRPAQTVSVVRDLYLADNVDRLLADPDVKVAIWAHNGHIMTGTTRRPGDRDGPT